MARNMKESGYKYLAEIPSHWSLGRSKHFFKEVSIKNHPQERVLSLYREYGVVPKDSRDDNHNVTSSDTSTYKLVNIGNLVINKMKAWQGSLAFSAYRGIISPAYLIYELESEDVEVGYLNYLLRSAHYADEFARLSTGIRIGQWDLHSNDFLNTVVVIPPRKEQIEIVAYLDSKCEKIDLAIEAAEKSIEEYKDYKKSLVFETVTKGLNPNASMRDSGIEWLGDIPDTWQTIAISQLANQIKEPNDGMKESNLLSLSYGKIKRRDIQATEGLLPASFEGYNIVDPDDIVLRFTDLQNDQKSLRVGRVTEKGIITSAYTTIRPLNAADSKYLYYCLHSFDLRKGFYGMGAGVRQGLKWQEAKYIEIPWPSLEERDKITLTLDEQCKKIDSAIEAKKSIIEELKAYKKSLIYEVVTGKREIDGC